MKPKEKELLSKLEARIKQEGLIPDTNKPGKFIKQENYGGEKKLKYLHPNNWVFHDQVVTKVLDGDYLEIMPYSGEFVTTMNCTSRCDSPCPYKSAKEQKGVWAKNDFSNPLAHMKDLGFAKELLEKLADEGVKGLVFTGGGEPFLFTDLEELVKHNTELGLDAVVYTNGNAVTEKRARKIVEASPLLVRVSLNAGTKNTYNQFHNPLNSSGAFERTLNSISYLAQGSLENPDVNVGVAVVFNEVNSSDLVESAKRVREIVDKTGGGITFITYRPAFDYFGTTKLQKELLEETHEIVETQVRDVLNGTAVAVANVTTRYEALMKNTRYYDACRASGLYVELSPSGELHLCCDRNCHDDYVIGDLTTNTLAEIWAGEQRKSMIQSIDSGGCYSCPSACKPHLANNQFAEIERLRDAGELYKVQLWIQEQRKMPIPKMVNF